MSGKSSCVSILGLSLGVGVSWGVGVFILAMMSWQFGWGDKMMDVLASIYVGYGASLMGALKGLLWGFADGFIGGFIIAIVHNMVACCSRCD